MQNNSLEKPLELVYGVNHKDVTLSTKGYTMFDEVDHKLLHLLQEEGRINNRELAERVILSPSATHTGI